ncbi:alpha/beta fold hydrolase [Rhodanobacter sp. DHB23]|uniref:alpha/beta fold hydrolase n=1 Tax=Rhodanobacter sp. DHB23 TaxID=2775923 RepID=UPI00177DCAB7|nr:alpha/beta fold hydrolase [Rhodanobacter sp. DHB23]MBD8873013.1 alpha/beta fold hydrolase [Rhodanobacter sp. DHB23]
MKLRSIPHVTLAAGMLLATPFVHAAAGEPAEPCAARSATLLDALVHAEYAGAGRNFGPELAAKLDEDKLKQAWAALQGQSGSYVSSTPVQKLYANDQPVFVTQLNLAKGPLDMVTACDAQGRIAMLRFAPPTMVAITTQKTAPHGVEAHVEADGVRVSPLDVPTPFGPLRGALTLPAGHGPFPAVVLVAGSGSHDMDETIGPNKPLRDIAEGLARAGIATLRYDKRPYDHPESARGMVIDTEVTDDAVAAAHLLAQQDGIDPKRVFVLGHSLGAMMAPRIGQRDPQLAGLVLMGAPARNILDVMEQQGHEQLAKEHASPSAIAQDDQDYARERQLLATVGTGQPAPPGNFNGGPQEYWLSWSRIDSVADAKSIATPMLILQGGSDFHVSPTLDFARWRQELAGRPHTSFHLYPGLSHLFMPAGKTGTLADYKTPGHVDAKVIDDIAAWVKAQPAH